MSEYIKKEDAIATAKSLLFCYGSDNIPDEKFDEYAEEFMNDDDNTIVEVVRCGECKHYINSKRYGMMCEIFAHAEQGDDFYCGYGERKSNEEE